MYDKKPDEKVARTWEEYRQSSRNFFWNVEVAALRRLLPPEAKILDLMCGPSLLLTELGEKNVVGLDYSHAMIKLGIKKSSSTRFVLGDVKHLPFKDNSFDFVCCMGNTIPTVPDDEFRQKILKETYRVLKPGGGFAFSFCNRYAINLKTLKLYRKVFLNFLRGKIRNIWDISRSSKNPISSGSLYVYSVVELKKTLCGIGFKNPRLQSTRRIFIAVMSCIK